MEHAVPIYLLYIRRDANRTSWLGALRWNGCLHEWILASSARASRAHTMCACNSLKKSQKWHSDCCGGQRRRHDGFELVLIRWSTSWWTPAGVKGDENTMEMAIRIQWSASCVED